MKIARAVSTGIHSLPDELLVSIFEFGGRITLQDAGNPFAMRTSQVSTRWRIVAHGTPSVWRTVPITNTSRMEIPAMYLQKSGILPLIVFLHAKRPGPAFDTTEALDIILKHSHRIIGLEVRTASAPHLFMAIQRLRAASAPGLKHFELIVDGEPSKIGEIPPIFTTEPPNLTSVLMQGSCTDLGSPLLRGLTSLTLSSLPRDMARPGYRAFRDLLSGSPQLKQLTLAGVFPKLLPNADYEIPIPSLEELDITVDHIPYSVLPFFRALTTPALQTLRFSSAWAAAWEGFVSAVPALSATSHDLRIMHLTANAASAFSSQGVIKEFFAIFPELRELVLNVSDDPLAEYFLRPWIEVSNGDAEHVAWPKLQLLTVRAPYAGGIDEDIEGESLDDVLETLACFRLSLGLPIDIHQAYVFDGDYLGIQQHPAS